MCASLRDSNPRGEMKVRSDNGRSLAVVGRVGRVHPGVAGAACGGALACLPSGGRGAGRGLAARRPGGRNFNSPVSAGKYLESAHVGTRKMVNYAWRGRSQRKLWWRSAAVLTCKSIARAEHRGERLIEPSSSWFPPKFPSG